MSSNVIIFRGDSPNKIWQSKVTGFITKWMDYTNSEEVTEAISDEETILIGYPTSQIVEKAGELTNKGFKVKVIENLCYDSETSKHFEAIDKMFFDGIPYCRSFEFERDEIVKLVKESIERTTGKEFTLKLDDNFAQGHYDSIDVSELICDIEDEYITNINLSRFMKSFKVRDFYKMLETGKLASNVINK